ncbi:periplasmic nitrate reductase, NapE protein [uncultured Roseovarius sp.]|uniref:periplasmic nitrate reductase, NapE protein n=1 Tax=uncultured Roseovarius sp. TaxID=293344 RepID=UPI002608295C|nr:periplasmic nitrate reductase, NapE protein [uncultured Roseovarius sp.]
MSQFESESRAQVDVVSKSSELRIFFFLAVLLAPILSFVLVGGYGFLIWMSQILLGPPSH